MTDERPSAHSADRAGPPVGDHPMVRSHPTGAPARLPAEEIARHSFGTVRRGFDPEEVRSFLEVLARQLEVVERHESELIEQLSAAEERARHPKIDEAALTAALGQRSASILRAAHDEAARIAQQAETSAATLLREAQQHATDAQVNAESQAAERVAEAELEANAVRQQAREEAAAAVVMAKAEGEALIERAREHGRAMLDQAQEARRRVLVDLAQRRRAVADQIEQFRAARDEVAGSVVGVRRSLERILDDLARADEEARTAANAARPHRGDAPETVLVAEAERAAGEIGVDSGSAIAHLAGSGDALLHIASPTRAPAEPTTPDALRRGDLQAREGAGPTVAGPPAGAPEPAGADEAAGASEPSGAAGHPGPGEPLGAGGAARADDVEGGHAVTDASESTADGGSSGAPAPLVVPVSPRGRQRGDATPGGDTAPDAAPEGAGDAGGGGDAAGVGSDATPEARRSGPEAQGPGMSAGTATDVDDLFARLRARDESPAPGDGGTAAGTGALAEPPGGGGPQIDEAEEPSRAPAAAAAAAESTTDGEASTDTALPPAQEPSPDELAFAARASAVEPIVATLARRLKRALQDDQNRILDVLRQGAGQWRDELHVDDTAQRALYADAAATSVRDCVGAGIAFARSQTRRRQGRAPLPNEEVVARITGDLAASVVTLLRRRLEGDAVVDPAERVGAAYREWRGERIERLAHDVVVEAFDAGVLAGSMKSAGVRWVRGGDGPGCADCEDNALTGAVRPGEAFPTGHHHPPAHPGCRCLLVPTST